MLLRLINCLIITASIAACHTQNKAPQPEAKQATATKKGLERNHANIAYDTCGTGDTTLLFIHGWCINKEYWEAQRQFFCPRYKVVTIDLPGFGQSGKNRSSWSFDEYTEDVKLVIDSLQLKNTIIIGHSMSGDIVLDVASKYPASIIGLIGIDNLHEPASPMSKKDLAESAHFYEIMNAEFDSTVSQYMRASLFRRRTPATVVNRVLNDIYSSDSIIAVKVLQAMTDKAQQEKKMMHLLQHKLYLINTDAFSVQKDTLKKYCKAGFDVAVMKDLSHYPMIEQPDLFNKYLQATINKIGLK